MASSDATPLPVKNQAFRATFPIFDADGDLVTAAGSLDSEVSKDGGTFSDCTNEATEIATSSGVYFLDLTATEMNADTVAVIVKSTGGKTTPMIFYPRADGADFEVDVTHWNGTAVSTPDTAGVPNVNLIEIDGNTTDGNNATLNLAQLNVVNSSGSAIVATASGGNGHGINASGNGSGEGILGTGGVTGHGIHGVGGATSGSGVRAEGSAGNSPGLECLGQGSNAGLRATGGATGVGARLAGGATAGAGLQALGSTSGEGMDIRGGSSGEGMYIRGGSISGSALKAEATGTNDIGLELLGIGTGSGLKTSGGATGAGASFVGGATSGDGIEASVTSGAEIDADITGDITGNLSGSVGSLTGHTVQTGDSFARLGAPAGADVSADVAAIKAETASILTDTGTTLETHLTDIKGGTFSGATDSLEAIRDRGDAEWTTGAGGSDRLLMVDTTIATLSSQTSFTLTDGSADDDAYNNCTIVIEDVSTSTQKAVGLISDYTGSTKTVTLKYDPAIFTMAATDKCYVLAENALKSTDANRQLDVTATGAAGIDWANVENPTTAVDLSGTDLQLVDTVTTLTGHTAQTGDSFARLGAPAGASVSADVAAVKVDTAATLVDTGTTIPATLGTPAADLAADIAAVKSDTAATLIDTATLGAPAGASHAADIAAIKSDTAAVLVDTGTTLPATLGTPAGADMSADIAAVKADSAAILSDTGTDGVVISAATATQIGNALLAIAAETGVSVLQLLQRVGAATAGEGAGTAGNPYKAIGNNGTDRVAMTSDSNGVRTASSYD